MLLKIVYEVFSKDIGNADCWYEYLCHVLKQTLLDLDQDASKLTVLLCLVLRGFSPLPLSLSLYRSFSSLSNPCLLFCLVQ